MHLVTLGGLKLEGSSYRGKLPLLLLTYLLLEGPKERGYLTELFWPNASDPRNSLSSALTKLGKLGDLADADEARAWAKEVVCDALDFKNLLTAGSFEAALAVYGGPFLDGVYHLDWGIELEEWVFGRREAYVRQARQALLRLGEAEAARGEFAQAAHRAERTHGLEVAPSYEPEELMRLYLLLRAGNSPLTQIIRDEAAGYGISLNLSSSEARGRLQRVLLGREREREQLASLEPGEWAWVRGGPGMGKTTLLKSLSGTLLPGRRGLPYATLEPLVAPVLHEGPTGVLARLRQLEGVWLIDNWERVDDESKDLLRRLREVGFRARAVVSSRQTTALTPDLLIELTPLGPDALAEYPGAWEQTKGLPSFVDAFLRGQPLHRVLSERLSTLPDTVRDIYLALALLDAPDPALVRRALGLDAGTVAQASEALLGLGLVEPHGQVRVRQAALEYLDAHPTQLGPLALNLARLLDDLEAFPLFERSRPLWTDADTPKAQRAFEAWAKELLRRGFPQRAVETLQGVADTREVLLTRSIALEKAGRFAEALDALEALSESAEVLALRASLFERLGHPAEAKDAAERALHGSTEARAKAQMTLGRLELYRAHFEQASMLFRRAATLYQALNRQYDRAEALNNEAVALSRSGRDAQAAFENVLALVGDNRGLQALAFLNLGHAFERQTNTERALTAYRKAIDFAQEAGALDLAAKAWNNMGVCFEPDDTSEATLAYRRSLELAQQSGEQRAIAVALGNLAALEEDEAAWDEAMHLLESAGQLDLITIFFEQLPPTHPFRKRSEVKV